MKNYTQLQAAHHAALLRLASPRNTKTGVQLWRALRKIESALERVAVAYCNGEAGQSQWEAEKRKAEGAVFRVFGRLPDGLYINGDPRGYMLKIDRAAGGFVPEGMHRDWGGYGILAPVIE